MRNEIERLIESGNLEGLLNKAGELHGQLCNYLAYGVMAGYIAMRELEVKNTGLEEIIAIDKQLFQRRRSNGDKLHFCGKNRWQRDLYGSFWPSFSSISCSGIVISHFENSR